VIEPIRTLFGRSYGDHTNRRTTVVEQTWWRCTECDKYFQRKEEAERHARREHSQSK
jgi:uncharacterized C2H2 Zn-finger protein